MKNKKLFLTVFLLLSHILYITRSYNMFEFIKSIFLITNLLWIFKLRKIKIVKAQKQG